MYLKHLNNVIDSVDCFLLSGFNFEFKMRSCFIVYSLPFQVKETETQKSFLNRAGEVFPNLCFLEKQKGHK